MIFRSKSVAQAKAGQAAPENANPTATAINSVEVAPPIQNLESDSKMEEPTGGIDALVDDSDEKPEVELDCGSSSVVKSTSCNQKTETRADDSRQENNKEQHEDLNQIPAIEDATGGDKPECNQPASSENAKEYPKADSEQAPSSTSTTGTSSSVGSVLSAERTTSCAGKPPLNRSTEKMTPSKYISRVQG